MGHHHSSSFLSLSLLLIIQSAAATCRLRNHTVTLATPHPTITTPTPTPIPAPTITTPTPIPSPSPAPGPSGKATAPVSSGPGVGSIGSICKHTDYPDVCLRSILPYLEANGGLPLDPATAFHAEVIACQTEAKVAKSIAAKMAADPTTSSDTVECLQICIENYDDALDNIDKAVAALAKKDLGTVNTMLSAALTDFSTCDDAFGELPATDSPMASYDDKLNKLSSNLLAIVQDLLM
ncbi:pectinesterase 3 [Amborella trichopoda]|uniref:Pectinesterase inhibitor domain-containing protein n=1 Tax=Amborella trichopoda TaxID=13333 RepID=W1NWU1_AMBTC|nr:pectinesterase 3 [Amborella trichopoda]ERN02102.1 hypothetical protein AMTR_s00045p00160800 [Amborella trichopoda]|eukprot:XP_006840427.1 pectinesterase 3 [Amborella trichopoda]